MNAKELKEEVLRAFVLSQSLEPLADKPGCTTRVCLTRHLEPSLSILLLSAVNSTYPILDLVDRIVENRGQPDCLFDIAYSGTITQYS